MADETLKIKAEIERFAADYAAHYIAFEKGLAEHFPLNGRTRRILCSINGKKEFNAALMPSRDGTFSIGLSKALMKRLGVEPGDIVEAEIRPDKSKYGMPMPPEFNEILRQDAEGKAAFHKLPIGKQRSILYYIGKIKDIDLKIHTGLIYIEHLKKNDGKIIYDEIKHELKRPI